MLLGDEQDETRRVLVVSEPLDAFSIPLFLLGNHAPGSSAFVGYAITQEGILKPIPRERKGWNYRQESQSVS